MPQYVLPLSAQHLAEVSPTDEVGMQSAVELGDWREYDLAVVRERYANVRSGVAAIRLDTGGPLTTTPDIDALMTGVAETVEAAEALGVRLVTVVAGPLDAAQSVEAQRSMVLAKLQAAAPLLEDAGVVAALGPDHGPEETVLLKDAEAVWAVVEEVASPSVKMLLEVDLSTDTPADVDSFLGDPDRVAYVRVLTGGSAPEVVSAALERIEGTGYAGFVALGS